MDIAAALSWLHAHAPARGDLKLGNIVLCPDGHCRLIDYSPSERVTPGYQAPEKTRSAAADVYALGVILWAMPAVRLNTRLSFPWTPACRATEVYDVLHKHS
ncbi:hypothetical protein DFH07DRAFT_962679 [Mycena maculata]|uniref:Protein kinase domain-containing protein n=1 Tax=Mycena maculata TaxID=230809 RepID=A0AAD7IMY2_9AGAR|nr:hypothetical protein DFH07DRAFT_962679 [Mycena maculata]